MSDLTCQFMDVMFIPNELDEIIRLKSHGIASWCEQLIKDMLGSEVIQIVDEDQAFPKKESSFGFLSPDASTTSLAFKKHKELSDPSRPRTPFYSESGYKDTKGAKLINELYSFWRKLINSKEFPSTLIHRPKLGLLY